MCDAKDVDCVGWRNRGGLVVMTERPKTAHMTYDDFIGAASNFFLFLSLFFVPLSCYLWL